MYTTLDHVANHAWHQSKLRLAPSFGNRVMRTQLGRMTRNEMADMLEGRFVQAGGRNLAFC